MHKTFANLSKISYLLYLALGSGVIVDALVATALCIALAKSRTGFRRTDSLINILIMYTINTSLITGIVAILCFILYAVLPHDNSCVVLAVFFNMSKLQQPMILNVMMKLHANVATLKSTSFAF